MTPATDAEPAAATAAMPLCEAASPGGPVFITESCDDPVLNRPYTDVDRPGSVTDPTTNVTVHYRYIHGGFTGTNAKFSFYFPAQDAYRGRFFQSTYPTITEEDATPDTIAFAISQGAYVVSTNNGGGILASGALGGYRINAAAAKYSRVVAAQVYRGCARPRGYLYGASGGAYQTVGAMENTSGVWDGAVPMVFGVPNAIPNFMAVQLLVLRVLGDKLTQVVDAVEPGGSGNPYAGLNAEQQEALREATRLGFPLRGWWQWATLDGGAFAAVEGGVRALDPTYVDDFWTKPGYAGSDPSVRAARVRFDTTVVSPVGSPTGQLVLAEVPTGDLVSADLVITSGAAAGRTVPIGTVNGTTLSFGPGADPTVTEAIRAGDQVRIDNSWLIALQYYQRHQVPTPDEYGWNQFRDPVGKPIYPQRPVLVGPILAQSAAGAVPNGRFHGRMIMLASVMDVQAFSWSADWYRSRAQSVLGRHLDDTFRLWYMDNADHDPGGPTATTAANAAAHIVSYTGELQQALLDLDAWVEHGTRPQPDTTYTVDTNTQVHLTAPAARRGGLQPVVTLSARTSDRHGRPTDRVEARVGEPVTFSMQAHVPPGAGRIVRVDWDFAGAGTYPVSSPPHHIAPTVNDDQSHTFTRPGTYFPVVRVTAHRDGDPHTPFALIQNLARVRVVVH